MCKILLWSVEQALNYYFKNFDQISNPGKIPLVGGGGQIPLATFTNMV